MWLCSRKKPSFQLLAGNSGMACRASMSGLELVIPVVCADA
jgi:hypothetical protein